MLLAPVVGCLSPSTVECSWDLICPAGTVCSTVKNRCVRPHYCGNGLLELGDGEICDDGNNEDGDECSSDCQSLEVCGNGILDLGEECDDGNLDPDDTCGPTCLKERCGNGYLDPGEVCDDNNEIGGDGCSFDCQSNETCRNGYPDTMAGEQCDDGNALSHDGCSSGCTLELLQWQQWQPSWQGRRNHAAAFDSGRGRVVLFGGTGDYGHLGDTWEYDGTTWIPMPEVASPGARIRHGMAYDASRSRTVLFGGTDLFGTREDTWEYDGTTWQQVFPVTTPGPRQNHAMAYDAIRQRVVLFGGWSDSGRLNDTWEYDGTDWVETNPAVSPPARAHHAMAYCTTATDQHIVLFGGDGGGEPSDLADTWVYDGTSWTQIAAGASPPSLKWHAMTCDSQRQRIVLFGGWREVNIAEQQDTWEFDGQTWTENTSEPKPPARRHHTLVFDTNRGRTVLVGGLDFPVNFADTWEYDGTDWTRVSAETSPAGRRDHGMAYDTMRGRVVLFGGNAGNTFLGDTWEHDGFNWIRINPQNAPEPRTEMAFAHDDHRGVMVLFGGQDGLLFGDTWEYDSTGWTRGFTAHSPSARYRTAMAHDAGRARIVLFGGSGGSTAPYLNDTWEYDGADWTKVYPPHSPPARHSHAMAYHPGLGQIVLFSGYCDGIHADTWVYDGTDWMDVTPDTIPPPRDFHRMVYNPQRDTVVLFGGHRWEDIDYLLNDAWEYDGIEWSPVPITGGAPSERASVGLAYHALRRELFVFGGEPALTDTWSLRLRSNHPDENCQNGADDDSDNLTDCADPDCDLHPVCQ